MHKNAAHVKRHAAHRKWDERLTQIDVELVQGELEGDDLVLVA
jgi:hypothetical protein